VSELLSALLLSSPESLSSPQAARVSERASVVAAIAEPRRRVVSFMVVVPSVWWR
jgi:hypothetical protein